MLFSHLLVLLTTIVVFKHVNSVTVIVSNVEGYYWREYTGELPSDAVPGGSDKYGKTTYIGQALHIFPPNGKLIPGKIDADEKQMYYAWGDPGQHVVTKNIKVSFSHCIFFKFNTFSFIRYYVLKTQKTSNGLKRILKELNRCLKKISS